MAKRYHRKGEIRVRSSEPEVSTIRVSGWIRKLPENSKVPPQIQPLTRMVLTPTLSTLLSFQLSERADAFFEFSRRRVEVVRPIVALRVAHVIEKIGLGRVQCSID